MSASFLTPAVVWSTWIWAVVFLPIETYLSFWSMPISISGYLVNVSGVALSLWGTASLRRRRPYAAAILATGWGWTTAAFWRATNLRYWIAGHGEPLSFGPIELWLAPIFTVLAGTILVGSLSLVVISDQTFRESPGIKSATRSSDDPSSI